jgi:hypothetical protein
MQLLWALVVLMQVSNCRFRQFLSARVHGSCPAPAWHLGCTDSACSGRAVVVHRGGVPQLQRIALEVHRASRTLSCQPAVLLQNNRRAMRGSSMLSRQIRGTEQNTHFGGAAHLSSTMSSSL